MDGCPESKMLDFSKNETNCENATGSIQSELKQWPIQMHLISPQAPYFQDADVVLTADCVAYALGGYHSQYLKGKVIGIACPKLDDHQEIYKDKIIGWLDEAKINTLTVMIMQVPCCGGLLSLAKQAASEANRKVLIKAIVVGIQGEILQEEWA